jgi:hypothetical protein
LNGKADAEAVAGENASYAERLPVDTLRVDTRVDGDTSRGGSVIGRGGRGAYAEGAGCWAETGGCVNVKGNVGELERARFVLGCWLAGRGKCLGRPVSCLRRFQ